jgi:hypothetical protein
MSSMAQRKGPGLGVDKSPIGEYPLDRHALSGEEGCGAEKNGCGGFGALVRLGFDVSNSGSIVNGDVQVVAAHRPSSSPALSHPFLTAQHLVSTTIRDTPEFLDIDMGGVPRAARGYNAQALRRDGLSR